VPPTQVSTLSGTMQTLITRWEDLGFKFFNTTRAVALTLVFEPDYAEVTLTGGWPAVTFSNATPPSPATESLTVSLANTPYGSFDRDTGHLMFHALVSLDFSPDPWFAKRDQQVEMKVSTNSLDLPRLSGQSLIQGSPFERLWGNEAFPELGLAGESEFETTSFLAWGRRGWVVAVIISGSLDPLPPRHPTPPPRTIVPDVRELDRDTADARVIDAGLVPTHIPSNAGANTRVSHQTPPSGQGVEVGSVVTLQLQAGSPL
jgi:PASTA domain